MNITLGGQRVGSGNRMNLHLRNYERSTHDLSTNYKTSAGIGILYPCYCKPALRGDKWDIKLAAGVRTIPSKGAMFGTYKLQIDFYFCPDRLYTGILHNNPVNIGLNMNKVYYPHFKTYDDTSGDPTIYKKLKFSTSSILHYMGLSGMGSTKCTGTNPNDKRLLTRSFMANPILAYYDIYKNYYSNKQEKFAYILNNTAVNDVSLPVISSMDKDSEAIQTDLQSNGYHTAKINVDITAKETFTADGANFHNGTWLISLYDRSNNIVKQSELQELSNEGIITIITNNSSTMQMKLLNNESTQKLNINSIAFHLYFENVKFEGGLALRKFDLTNIDDMRAQLLSYHTMGAPYVVNEFNKLPYSAVAEYVNVGGFGRYPNKNALNGLCIKTYQSDMFNNWLSTEFVDGANGIANITRVNTEGGGFTIDSLNFSEKMYNLLNRIIASGNTYEDWQNVVYENTPKRHLESPMYLGGESQEIVFEEIIATANTTDSPLGTMGGRGLSRHRKGGHIRFKCEESGFIIGIMSITPRINYSQNNEFFFTDVHTPDDYHKPALDGIGFQDLIGERMAYFDTFFDENGQIQRHTIGKLPAWIEYMTDVDHVHGDLADGKNAFMVLNRNYEFDDEHGGIADATTYVEPNKYNDCFYYTARDAQNFWVQINMDITTRRKMSAKQIPNL